MPAILLVEDNHNLAQAIGRDLSRRGFQVNHVAGGKDALQELARNNYDAMILDWMLPDLDGLEVLRRLQEANRLIPVIMLTARADEADRIVGLEVGADDYLTKPFSMHELAARIHAILRRVEKDRLLFAPDAKEHQEPLQWREVLIDEESHCVLLKGEAVDLTPIEFALLDLFVRNPGRTFNRAYLMDNIWRQEHIPGDRSVDNAILRLRRKIYPHGEAIEAVWGVGYRLRDKQ